MSEREFYRSDAESKYLAKRKLEARKLSEDATNRNSMLVGAIKEYKGISYQMNQRGQYQCVNLHPLSGLDGTFTSSHALHSIIDNMEIHGTLEKS